MSLRGRHRSALRHRFTSDETKPRLLAVGALGAALSAAALLAFAPRGSIGTPGPLSASHTAAKLECKTCHDAKPSATSLGATNERVRVGTGACTSCHGEHALRNGHARAAAQGILTCATCHPPHGAEAVRFLGEGRALHSTTNGTTEVAAAPIASGTTVPVMRSASCRGCHDLSKIDDPLRACVDASGASSPPLVVRCLGEHERGGAPFGKSACVKQHDPGRFAARDAAVRVASGTSVARAASLVGLPMWLGLGPVGLGLLAYAGARVARKRRTPTVAAPVVATRTRKLPVIDASRCLGCYACVDACAFDVLTIERYVAKVARPESCCGAVSCEAACPNGSLVMREEGEAPPGPKLTDSLESAECPGVFFAGDVTGVPLIRNAVLHGRSTMDAVAARKKTRPRGPSEDADVVIIGAGPAGLAASLRAEELGISYVTLEQHAVAASIKSFPRGKLIFDAPFELPLEGEIFVRECTKEELVAQWSRIVRTRKPRILEQHRVTRIERSGDTGAFAVAYRRVDESEGVLRAASIVVAVGQRGTPRKLDATIDPGAETMVADALFDARAFAGKRVVVVGLGDSAMEAAQALAHQPGTQVTLVHRGKGFERGRARNIEEVQSLVLAGRIALRLETRVAHVGADRVVLAKIDGSDREELETDAVLALIGGTPGLEMLRALGLALGDRSFPSEPRKENP